MSLLSFVVLWTCSQDCHRPVPLFAGISEGMLSGCCGVLSEQVRRQIYIIRTSGARLLALINDVMDAAALRHNKLVLKQEHVSGDETTWQHH